MITGANGTGQDERARGVRVPGHAALLPRRAARGDGPDGGGDAAPSCARELSSGEDGPTLVEAEIEPAGRSRTRVNRKAATARKDLAAAAPVHDLLARGPGARRRRRRRADATSSTTPWRCSTPRGPGRPTRPTGCCASAPRCSASRAAGSAPDVVTTLDVWDQRLADAGKVLVAARERLVADLEPLVAGDLRAPGRRAGTRRGRRRPAVQRATSAAGTGDLPDALAASRTDDLRRGVNTVGPHRDELAVGARRAQARTPRLAGRAALPRPGPAPRDPRAGPERKTELRPTLLLDDVFSELDPVRSRALVAELPAGQSILTTASPLPEGIAVAAVRPGGGRCVAGEAPVRSSDGGGRGGSVTRCPALLGRLGGAASTGDHGGGLRPLGRGRRGRPRAHAGRCASTGAPSWWRPTTRRGRPGHGWNRRTSWSGSRPWARVRSSGWKS